MKVIIAEDDPRLLQLYEDFGLKKLKGVEVKMTKTGEETLSCINKNSPDILLLDIFLPDKNGLEILEQLKKEKKTEKIKIFICTNFSDDQSRKRALELGAKGYIIKSNISYETMKHLIEKGEMKE